MSLSLQEQVLPWEEGVWGLGHPSGAGRIFRDQPGSLHRLGHSSRYTGPAQWNQGCQVGGAFFLTYLVEYFI